jgi:hypothetical protein
MAALHDAALIGFYLPMHTATRLALRLIPQVRRAAPHARLCAFGLYPPLMAEPLRAAGVDTVLGGEFEAALVALATRGGRAVGTVGQVGAGGCEIHEVAARPRQTTRRGPDRAGAPGAPGPVERQAGRVAQPLVI